MRQKTSDDDQQYVEEHRDHGHGDSDDGQQEIVKSADDVQQAFVGQKFDGDEQVAEESRNEEKEDSNEGEQDVVEQLIEEVESSDDVQHHVVEQSDEGNV